MTKRADAVYLSDILSEAEIAVKACSGLSLDQFEGDAIRVRGIERCLEVIGEAASKISPETKTRLSTIPWSKMAAMRNRIAHAYWGSDTEIILATVQKNLPELICQLTEAGVKAVPARQKAPIK